MQEDIQNIHDIEHLVNQFYDKVQKDTVLGPIFNSRIQNRWPEHLAKMYRFWESILLGNNTYNGRPFPPHANLPVDQSHFERWKALFFETVDTNFKGPVAEEAKFRATKIAEVFLAKITYFQSFG